VCLVAACTPPADDHVDPPDPDQGLAVMATSSDDYTVGALTVVGLADHTVADVAAIYPDAVLSVELDPDAPGGAILWEINRLMGDTVRRYTPGVWDAPVWEVSVGEGANPQDAATCGGRLFVSLYERASLAILSPDSGESLGSVDLSSVADDDGLPEVSGLFVQDDVLYAVVQRLDRTNGWTADPGGQLVQLDCASGAVTHTWPLGPNPQLGGQGLPTFASRDGVRAFVDGDVTDVLLGPVDGAPVVDLAVSEAGVGAFVARDGTPGSSHHAVGCIDASTTPWTVTTLESLEHYVPDVAVHGDQAWFAVRRGWADPTDEGGVMIVDLKTCTAVGDDWLRPQFAPFSLGFVPCSGDACDLPAAEGG
jgi:hypothetical protein